MNASNAQTFAFVVGLVTALVTALKQRPEWQPWVRQFGPLLAIAFGVALTFLVSDDPAQWRPLVIEGLVAGLAACGLYDAATAARKSG